MSHFTVKRIVRANGVSKETIYPVDNYVEVFFADTNGGKFPKQKHYDYEFDEAALFIDAGPKGQGFMFTEGYFYVVNESGRTVGSYCLDKTAA